MKKLVWSVCCMFFVLLLSSGHPGESEGCELKKDSDGIKIYSCKSRKSVFNDIESEFDIKATPNDYIEALLDVKHYDTWHFRSENPRILKRIGEKELIYYEKVSAPWPVSDRDMIIHLKIIQDAETGNLTVTLKSMPDYIPEVGNVVRIIHFYSVMRVSPIDQFSTHYEFHLELDPAGFLPGWAVNMASTDGPFESFKNLKDQLEKNKF